ncbi:MAG: oligosaccharide flippase family protein [Calditrichaeota bacterium]|nr:oligosaccharide flippase family protein [Calditrichota bacterium]
MIDHLKNLARHSSIYTVSTFVQRALGFVMLPIYTDPAFLASRSEYGDLALVYTFTAFMNIVYLYGMDAAILRYFFLGKFKRNEVYSTGFWGVLANSLALSALLFVFAPQLGDIVFGSYKYSTLIRLSAAILFFDSLGNLPYLILRAEEKSIHFSAFRIGRFFLELILNILFVVILRKGVLGILYANLIASVVNLIALLPYQNKYLKIVWNREIFKVLALFGLPMLPNGLAYLTVEVSDKFLMRFLLNKDLLGLYSASYKFGSLLLLVVIAFRNAWQPFFLKIANEPNAKQIYARVLTYFTLIGAFLIVAGSFSIDYIVKIPIGHGRSIMNRTYWDGIKIIPIILSAYLFYGIYVNFTVGIYIKKKTRYMIIFTGVAALVNIGSNLFLMPRFGIMGAAFATLLSYLIMAATIFIANQKIYKVPYEYGRVLFILTYLFVMIGIYYLLTPNWYQRLGLIVLSPVLFFALRFFRKEEWAYLIKLVKKS